MSAIVLTLVIGVLNLSLGYALAVRLGYGPPSLLDTWEVFAANGATRSRRRKQPADVDKRHEAVVQPAASTTLEEMLNEADDEPYDELYDEPEDEPREESAPEQLEPARPENWDLDERHIEVSVLKLNIAMMRSCARATDIEKRLRSIRGRSDLETIQRCLAELLEDCEAYLAEQSEATECFHDRIGELGELSALGHEIETANLEQEARIRATINNLQNLDFRLDPEAANLRLLEEIHELRVARHKLRDDQEKAFLIIARHENRMDQIGEQFLHDALTRLPNRIGLETTLWQWWQEGRHQSRQISVALFDLDRFGHVNQRYDSLAGDRILHQLGRVIRETAGEADLVARFAGQRFLMVILDLDPRAAIKRAEFTRQSIERITFLYGEDEIRVTAASGIAEVTPDDTHETLFGRLEQALRQAKQAGPNRSFFHDGRATELIEPPNLGAEYVEIPI